MKHILVPIDFSAVTDAVLRSSTTMANAMGAELTLLNVGPREPDVLGYQLKRKVITEPVPDDLKDRHAKLMDYAAELEAQGISVEARLIRGDRIRTVLAEAERVEADLIVMGSHGRGALYRSMMGSVSEGVLRKANCPMLIVPTRVVTKPSGADEVDAG